MRPEANAGRRRERLLPDPPPATRGRASDGRRRERGTALAAVLLAMSLLLPLGALAVLQARVGLLTQQSLRGDAEALHAAEAGLACALARLEASADFGLVLRGPDAIAGTADDGAPPFALDCAAGLPAPMSFGIRLEPGRTPDGIVIVATGRGFRGAMRTVEQHVRRGATAALERVGWRER